jgi:cAMP-dependent protein kinase regulator
MHVNASGEVAVVGHETREPNVNATIGVGDVVGEVGVILRRKSAADVVAVHPTVSLYLSRQEFLDLVVLQPAMLAGLYMLAVERDEETSTVFSTSTTDVAEDYVLV